MRLPPLAALLSLLGACAVPPTEMSNLSNQELLNRLPAQLGPLPATGPAQGQAPDSATRLYRARGVIAAATLVRPA